MQLNAVGMYLKKLIDNVCTLFLLDDILRGYSEHLIN